MRIDPHTLGLTVTSRQAETNADAQSRLAMLERGGNGTLIGGASGVSWGLSVPPGLSGRGYYDPRGDLVSIGGAPYNVNGGAGFDLRHGTDASPATDNYLPSFKVSRVDGVTTGTGGGAMDSGAGGYQHAAIAGDSKAASTGSKVMIVGVSGTAENATAGTHVGVSNNLDACGISGLGKISGSGGGLPMGGFFEAQGAALTAGGSARGVHGIEVLVTNTGTAGSGGGTGAATHAGIFLDLSGPSGGSAIEVLNVFAAGSGLGQWTNGIHFCGPNFGPVIDSTFKDDGRATNSLNIQGLHTNAMVIGTGSGDVIVGSTVTTGGRLYVRPSSAAQVGVDIQGNASQSVNLLRVLDSTGALKTSIGPTGFLGIGVTAGASAITVQTPSLNDKILADAGAGGAVYYFGNVINPIRYDIEHGDTTTPVTTEGPTFKISRTQNFPTTTTALVMPKYCAMEVEVQGKSNSNEQGVGILGVAHTNSTQAYSSPQHSADAVGINGVGIVEDTGILRAIGGVFQGHCNTTGAGTSKRATGAEAQTWNELGSAAPWLPGTPDANSYGFLSTCGGLLDSSVAFECHFLNRGGKWDTGFGIPSTNPVRNFSFRDEGNAPFSLLINGTHSGAAIQTNTGAGDIRFNTTSSLGLVTVKGNADQRQLVVQANTTQTAVVFQVLNSSATSLFSITNAGTVTMADAANISVGATTGTKIGTATTQRIGFWNKTPVPQASQLTSRDASAINTASWTVGNAAIMENMRLRLNEIADRLNNSASGVGLIAGTT